MSRPDVPRPTGPTLDDEGIPDLEGPLAEKEMTGDPQEGASPPAGRPASLDYGVTPREQADGEPISVRVQREVPDVVEADEEDQAVRLVDLEADSEGEPDDDGYDPDDDGELVASVEEPGVTGLAAEDAAVHVRDDAPGAVWGPDSYVPEDPPPDI
jgi:hypothetical protein